MTLIPATHNEHRSKFSIHQKLGRYNHRDEEPGDRVEQLDPGLPVHISDVPEIPGHQQIRFIDRRQSDVQRISKILPVKYASLDVSISQNRGFIADLDHRQVANQIQISRPARLFGAFQLADDQRRDARRIISKLVFPPPNREVSAKRFSVVQVSPDNRCLEIKALFHAKSNSTTPVGREKPKEKSGPRAGAPRVHPAVTRVLLYY